MLLVSCPDRAGIVAAVATFVAEHGGNVVDLQQHTDHTDGAFFQRVEFELDGVDLARGDIAPAFAPVADEFAMRWSLRFTDERPRVAIARLEGGALPPGPAQPLAHRGAGHRRAGGRQQPPRPRGHGGVVRRAVRPPARRGRRHVRAGGAARRPASRPTVSTSSSSPATCSVLSPAFCMAWQDRIINIHHSFLPAFQGARPYHQAHERGVKVIGVTAHYATADLDDGTDHRPGRAPGQPPRRRRGPPPQGPRPRGRRPGEGRPSPHQPPRPRSTEGAPSSSTDPAT